MKLVVNNFRSHQHYQVEFTAGMNIITGPNGSGKTTLLEAIYVALMGKSLSLIHISEPTRQDRPSRMPSSA